MTDPDVVQGEISLEEWKDIDSLLLKLKQGPRVESDVPPPITRLVEDFDAGTDGTSIMDTLPNPHRAWYDFVEEHTRLNPISTGDRLCALWPESQKYDNAASEDKYDAGMWLDDLFVGLLWHNSDFESSEPVTQRGKPLQKVPNHPRTPSWSWGGVDGSVRFLHSRSYYSTSNATEVGTPISPVQLPLVNNLKMHTMPTLDFSKIGSQAMGHGCISLHGQMLDLKLLRGFNQPFATWMRENRALLGYDCTPDISMDPSFSHDCVKYVLPMMRKRCHPRCRHSTGCDKDQMAYGLVLHFVGQGGQYDGLPALHVARSQSKGDVKYGVEVFMRCGVVAFYMSSFEHVAWQDAVIL